MAAVDAPPPPSFGDPGYDAFDDLWSRLSRPFEMVPTVAAVVGLPTRAVAQLAGMAVATSAEADELLEMFPKTVRSLATSVHNHPERCIGSLRGPVLWSETMSARSASYGDPDLFVCSTPSRAYDIDENHVLVHALSEVHDAAMVATQSAGDRGGDHTMLRAVRHNGAMAARYLDHPSLRLVSRRKPKGRAIKRTRSGKHRKWYAPALRAIERAATPLSPSEVSAWRDERTSAQHHVLMGVVHRLERSGTRRVADFRAENGALLAGDVEYRHPRYLGDRSTLSGVLVDGVLIDVPDRLHDPNRRRASDLLKARGGGRDTVVVFDERDLDRAVELVIERRRTSVSADQDGQTSS
jgi:hypothetical protein